MVTIGNLVGDSVLTGNEVVVLEQSDASATNKATIDVVSQAVKEYIQDSGTISIAEVNATDVNSDTSGDHTGTIDGVATAQIAYKNAANIFSVAQQFNAGISGTTGNFSGNVEAGGFTIGGVPVGTSSDTYWSAIGDGGISYADYINPASISTAILKSIDQIVASSASIVDVFVYDTSKDSDGGAWREKCQEKAWYNEELNTATRGATRKFPAKALIVAISSGTSADKITIYDMDSSSLPMWMVFEGVASGANIIGNMGVTSRAITSVKALNGEMVATNGGTNGTTSRVNFLLEKKIGYSTTSNMYKGNIEQRNDGLGVISLAGSAIVNAICNDVAMKVLPNALVDETTGLPIPTIVVGTNAGVSVITDSGVVWDIVSTLGGAQSVTNNVAIDNNYVYGVASATNRVQWFKAIPTSDVTFNGSEGVTTDKFIMDYATPASSPATNATQSTNLMVLMSGNDIAVRSLGVNILNKGATLAESMVAYITTTYNTGWMPGDILGAWLSSNDSDNLSGGELVTNGDMETGSPPSSWSANGGAGWSAEAVTVHSGSQSGKMTRSSSGQLVYQSNTFVIGQQYTITGWIYIPSVGGPASANIKVGTALAGGDISDNLDLQVTTQDAWTQVTGTFSATATNLYINLYLVANGYVFFDDISMTIADPDRSVNDNGLQVYGTVTKSAVATGAELMAYSGFSSSNYLEQPYNSDLDYGTGDFCIDLWLNSSSFASSQVLIQRGDGTNSYLYLWLNTSGVLQFGTIGATVAYNTMSAGKNSKITIVRRSGSIYFYLNAIQDSTVTADASSITGSGDETLRIGLNTNGGATPATYCSFALVRISAYAPTAEQITKMYEDEKYMFQENAQCCLSNSNVVNALSYDEDTEKLMVGTNDGTDIFKGLQRIDYIDTTGTPTNDAINSVSIVDDTYAIGTGAEVVGYIPAINVREELTALKEKELPEVGISLNSDGETEIANDTRFKEDVEIEGDAIMASGKGVDFSATSDGSGTVTSEILTDYEEGTWPAVLSDALSGGNVATGTTLRATYTKIGRLVTVFFAVNNINVTGSSVTAGNGVFIQGLPYTNVTTTSTHTVSTDVRITNIAGVTGVPEISLSSAVDYLLLTQNIASTNPSTIIWSQLSGAASDLAFTITYEVS